MIESLSDILIITDVDGTLLRENKGISKENLEAIKRFTDKGGHFTVSTGRAIDVARDCGLKGIKFYGMIGLPTETQEDIEEIVNLSKRIKQKYKGFDINFGFSTFVPKANTPFQWFGREDEKSLEKKSNYLKKELHKLGIQISISSAKWDYYQALLSRGDENLADYVIEVYKQGGKLGAYKKIAKEMNINTDYYATETYSYDKPLPWDFIEIKPGKEFLMEEAKQLVNR